MKTLSDAELEALAGQYFAPAGLYQHTKSLPFLGTLKCSTKSLIAGQWTELLIEYTVGASGLADGAWIKGTFKFYSDWALFQTSDRKEDNHVTAEYVPGPLHPGQTPATIQSLAVRFDQKGHERPFQKAIIIDVVDGYMNPADKIIVRVGDRRWGAKGTRVQTFVEDEFLMRWYIDPVGTSRFAPIKPDLAFDIKPGAAAKLKAISPRLVWPGTPFPLHLHTEDAWGNATVDLRDCQASIALLRKQGGWPIWERDIELPEEGWTVASITASLPEDGEYVVSVAISMGQDKPKMTTSIHVTADSSLPVPRPLFADLHLHSDDTVGTNSTSYNFSYARQVAGLDVVGYTANDFNITQDRWDRTLEIIKQVNEAGEFVVFPGTEWCGNSSAGGDHNVVFLDDPDQCPPAFPRAEHEHEHGGSIARSLEWNEHGPAELTPGAWPLDELYATYAHRPDGHLLIPHVGGRRCNLAWHHPGLERLLEIGSAWGLFEMGVSANSDEHRGRCGGGVPGTAVFGTKGGLTGVLAESLNRRSVAEALRARRTFATTGERLVGIVSTADGSLQGSDVVARADEPVVLTYSFYGDNGFSSIEAWDGTGQIFSRNLLEEVVRCHPQPEQINEKIRVRWGGARLYDRYREAVWEGSILVAGAEISHMRPFGGVLDSPEDVVAAASESQVVFRTRTSGDFDGVDIFFRSDSARPSSITVTGTLGGYVKLGDVLAGNSHRAQPGFSLVATTQEVYRQGGKRIDLEGGVGLFVSVDVVADLPTPTQVRGRFTLSPSSREAGDEQAVYFVGREYSGGKVITSPIFIGYRV
ncbi:hypothetical protein GGR56DRAFT_668196 [Xylariaceae sp. FL0804]|nr:hypothetical protein GGR56DRAFT_668196 [Xylariaceae sp. FL0804]